MRPNEDLSSHGEGERVVVEGVHDGREDVDEGGSFYSISCALIFPCMPLIHPLFGRRCPFLSIMSG
jgi:hypothetical protein